MGSSVGRYDEETVERLLAVARDATLGGTFEERLTAVWTSIRALVPLNAVWCFAVDAMEQFNEGVPHALFLDYDLACGQDYMRDYRHVDPTAQATLAAPGSLLLTTDLIPRPGGDVFTHEFLEPRGLRYGAAACVPLPHGKLLLIGTGRDRGELSAHESRLLNLVLPDVARAAYGAVLAEELAATPSPTDGEEDEERSGLAVLNAVGDLVHVSPAARRLLATAHPNPADHLVAMARYMQGRSDEVVQCLPRGGGGWLRAAFAPLPGGQVALLLDPVPAGSEAHYRIEVARAGLTPREEQVARLAVTGHSNSEIGRELGLSGATVKIHLSNAYRKAGVDGRTELTALLLGGRRR